MDLWTVPGVEGLISKGYCRATSGEVRSPSQSLRAHSYAVLFITFCPKTTPHFAFPQKTKRIQNISLFLENELILEEFKSR